MAESTQRLGQPIEGTEIEQRQSVRIIILRPNMDCPLSAADADILLCLPSDNGDGFWDHPSRERLYTIPGGGTKEGETLEEAVKREAFQETGLRVNFVHKLGEPQDTSSNAFHPNEISHIFIVFDFHLFIRGQAQPTQEMERHTWKRFGDAIQDADVQPLTRRVLERVRPKIDTLLEEILVEVPEGILLQLLRRNALAA